MSFLRTARRRQSGTAPNARSPGHTAGVSHHDGVERPSDESVDTHVSIDDLMVELRSSGQRATTARRAVLEQLLEAGDTHLTADELAQRVGEQHPAIHLSTIYRTLESLDEAGLISPARFADHSATYHLTDDVHHHAVCTQCGRTFSLAPAVFQPVAEQLLAEFGFVAVPQHLTIHGQCGDCALA